MVRVLACLIMHMALGCSLSIANEYTKREFFFFFSVYPVDLIISRDYLKSWLDLGYRRLPAGKPNRHGNSCI